MNVIMGSRYLLELLHILDCKFNHVVVDPALAPFSFNNSLLEGEAPKHLGYHQRTCFGNGTNVNITSISMLHVGWVPGRSPAIY